jgi:hypothetical protein
VASAPPIKEIRLEDVTTSDGDLDAEKLVAVLNPFLQAVSTALTRGLTFTENFRCMFKTLPVQTGADDRRRAEALPALLRARERAPDRDRVPRAVRA